MKKARMIEDTSIILFKPVWLVYSLEENGHVMTEFGKCLS